MDILFISAEVTPFIKTEGFADVAGALPPALRGLGHGARIVMPRDRKVRTGPRQQADPIAVTFLPIGERQEELRVFRSEFSSTPVYMRDIPEAFDSMYGDGDDERRFILFTRGVLALVQHLHEIEGWQPQVINANDWHAGLILNYLKTFYSYTFGHIATVFTIHNLAYQGRFGTNTLHLAGLREGGMVELCLFTFDV